MRFDFERPTRNLARRGRRVAVVLTLAALACGRSSPERAAETHLYVSDETGGNVVVIDPVAARVVTRIAVGKRPRGIRASRDGARLFVALSGSPIAGPGVDESSLPPADRSADGIGVVDLATLTLVRTFTSGPDPESFDLSPDGKTLYVSNEDTAEVSAVDVATGTIRGRVSVGEEPEGVTVRPGGREVYVTSEGTNEVTAIDTTTLQVVARIPTAARPRAVVFTTDGATAFVTNENAGVLTVVDAAAHKASGTVQIPRTEGTPTPPRPMGMVLSADGREVFTSLGRAGSVAVIDVAGRRVARSIERVGARPWGIGVSGDGRKLYTANGPSGDVSIIDVATGTVEARVTTGGSPWGLIVVDAR